MKQGLNYIFSIIGDRYLDTQHSKEYLLANERKLKELKVTGIKRWILEYIAASAFWWNIIVWEWFEFDGGDVIVGWIMNLQFLGVPALIIGLIGGINAFVITFLVLHIITTSIGFLLRCGTVAEE